MHSELSISLILKRLFMRPELSVSLVLFVITLGLLLYGKRQRQPSLTAPVVVFVICLVLLWNPLSGRDMFLAIITASCAFFFCMAGIIAALISISVVAALFGLAFLLPGGLSAVLLLLAIGCLAIPLVPGTWEELHSLLRLRRLEPGKLPSGKVWVEGMLEASQPITQPIPDVKCAAWRLRVKTLVHDSTKPMLLKSPGLNVLIELAEIRTNNSKFLTAPETERFLEEYKLPPITMEPEDKSILSWLKEGQEICVIGMPTMEARMEAQSDDADQYRETAMMPVFRHTEEQPVRFCFETFEQLLCDARWFFALMVGVLLEFLVVAGYQIFIERPARFFME
jgi:hypothetical protein